MIMQTRVAPLFDYILQIKSPDCCSSDIAVSTKDSNLIELGFLVSQLQLTASSQRPIFSRDVG